MTSFRLLKKQYNKRSLLGALMVFAMLVAFTSEGYAQGFQTTGRGSTSNTRQNGSQRSGRSQGRSTDSSSDSDSKKKVYPPGSAWTLSYPLGTHIESTLDTLLYNYQRRFVTALNSDAWASTGQFTGPAINMLYFDRPESSPFIFNNALSYWLPNFSKQKFYNVYIPMTQLEYGWGYGTENRTDHLSANFAGNVNRRLGFGAWIDYPYTKGSYAYQAAKGITWGITGYYNGDRYDAQALFNMYNHVNKENGGITDDLYITNPAELQGGVNDIEPQSIPTRLTAAHSRLTGAQFYMNHAYKVGFWRDITQETDTVEKKEYVPVTKFVYSLDYRTNHHFFINTDASEARDFWRNTYFNSRQTRDDAYYWSLSNTLGIEMIEGFQKWAKFGLSAYATYEYDKYRYEVDGMQQIVNPPVTPDLPDTPGEPSYPGEGEGVDPSLTTLPSDWRNHLKKSRNRLWVGGRLEKTKGSILTYSADAKFGLSGDVVGDIDVRGEMHTKFKLGKDTVRFGVDGYFKNSEPNYMLNHYVGNHFYWNNNFGKIRSFRVQGKLHIPWTWTTLRVGFDNVQNHIYFNSAGMPQQNSGNVQVFSAAIQQNLKLGIFNWDNTVTYQKTSDMNTMPLPELTVYSNMYIYFKAFRALTVQFGVDCNWYSKYKGYNYQPATMQFTQQGENAVDVGNFINSDVYLTCKLYKIRFFVMVSHLSQGWFKDNYFALPHYPVDPRQFRLGFIVDFTN